MARTFAWRSAACAALAAAAFACQEEVIAPGHCPELCPADSLVVEDTVLTGIVSSDTSLRGYTRMDFLPILVTSNTDSLRAFVLMRFPALPQRWFPTASDTVTVGPIDSVTLDVRLDRRDTSVHNTRLLLHRIPHTTDTLATFDSVVGIFAGAPFDSIPIHDTIRAGVLHRLLPVASITPIAADSFTVAIGLDVRGDAQTTARLLASDAGFAPVLTFYVRGAAPRDTFKTSFPLPAEFDTWVQSPDPGQPGPDAIVVGGQLAARAFVRFDIPRYFVDSVNVVRATLQLTPTRAVRGMPFESTNVVAQPILRYFDGKSILFQDSSSHGKGRIVVGQTTTVEVEMAMVLRLWRAIGPDSLPRAISLRNEFEEFTTLHLDAAGRTAGAAAPRLRISFIRPFRFGVP